MSVSHGRRFRLHLLYGWLFAGATLALWLPVSPDNTTLGWTGIYWLLAAPGLMLAIHALAVGRRTQPSIMAHTRG